MLGMVAVQVERDPKTGATVIRSVAPVSAGAGVPGATVFDDGRKSVHAIGGAGGGPSAEELGQILSVINDVGMQVLLDEVTAAPHGTQKGREEVKREQEEEEEDGASEEKEGAISDRTHNALLQKASVAENIAHLNSTESYDLGAGEEREGCYESGGEDDEDEEEEDVTLVEREMDEATEERGGEAGHRLDQAPVTLTFLGYTEAAGGQGLGHEDNGEVLKVERVIISDDGDEEDKEEESDSEATSPPQTEPPGTQELPASETRPQPPTGSEPAEMDGGGGERQGQTLAFPPGQGQGVGGVGGEGEVLGKGAPEVLFQDVPLDGNGAGALREEAGQGAEPPNQAPPSRAEGKVAPKHKTCQCCTVM